MKKERLFYLDFVRALATLIIILTHYNATFLYTNPQTLDNVVLTAFPFHIYIGDWGVSLFLIISGAALMYVYEEKLDLLNFYKKRFLNIFPMFWIAYGLRFLFAFYETRSIPAFPRQNLLLSVIGMDQYASVFGVPAYTLVGEWFLGFIILVYLVFPLLRYGVVKHPRVTIVLAGILYVFSFWKLNGSVFLTMRLPEILFGMFFVHYIKKVNWKMILLPIAVCIFNIIVNPGINGNLQTTYIGIATFLILAFIAQYLKWKPIHNVCNVICKYSYPCFLVHHGIINRVIGKFDVFSISRMQSVLILLICCVLIAVESYLLFHIEKKVVALFRS